MFGHGYCWIIFCSIQSKEILQRVLHIWGILLSHFDISISFWENGGKIKYGYITPVIEKYVDRDILLIKSANAEISGKCEIATEAAKASSSTVNTTEENLKIFIDEKDH